MKRLSHVKTIYRQGLRAQGIPLRAEQKPELRMDRVRRIPRGSRKSFFNIMARFTPVLRRLLLHRLPETAWRRVSQGINVADSMVTLPSWSGQARRVVCLRQELRERPPAAGRRLIDYPG